MVLKRALKLESRHRAVSFHDITDQVKEIVKESKVKDGIVVVYSHHTTCSVITQECAFDMSMTGLETLQQDLVNVFEKWIPTCRYEGMYLHPGQKALDFALEHNLLKTSSADAHWPNHIPYGGITTEHRITNEKELADLLRSGEYELIIPE